ncbi:MAG: type III-B CRISPR-associated protein Cas10/Cmr2 [Caldilineales bacterium]|nr:type III-B CRISPR-associated protein Cas10/Cmr2 [Caldilineales bacterium]
MNNDEFWALKIVALLHDPPGKALNILVHERDAKRLIEIALGRPATSGEWRQAKDEADLVASAFDRANFPKYADENVQPKPYLSHNFVTHPILVHPLGGEQLNLDPLQLDQQAIALATESIIQSLMVSAGSGADAMRRRYLLLWRWLLPTLRAKITSMGALWDLIPAETRIPDHGIWAHQSATAAVATALPDAALLVFTFGPVQEFIEAARRTQDLWAGSFILSYLAWSAMKPIVAQFGPDAILYPSLWEQPLVDIWLRKEIGLHQLAEPPKTHRLRATLPNRFVALLPSAAAKQCAEAASQALNRDWSEMANDVRNSLEALLMLNPGWNALWERQIGVQWQTYWAVQKWPPQPVLDPKTNKLRPWMDWLAEAIKTYKEFMEPLADWEFEKRVAVFQRPSRNATSTSGPRWGTNIGTAYGPLHHLAQRTVEARKGLRDFRNVSAGVLVAEQGEKDTLEGRLEALHRPGQDSRREVRQFWTEIADRLREGRLRGEKRFTDVAGNGRERLSAVGAVKRFAFREHFEHNLEVRVPPDQTPLTRFPSTSSVAAAPFKARVLEHLLTAPPDDRLATALKDYLKKLAILDIPQTAGESVLPGLAIVLEQLREDGSPHVGVASAFLMYDGDLLFPETYAPTRLKEDYNRPDLGDSARSADRDAAMRSLNDLMKVAAQTDLIGPSSYFAILKLDVDKVGQWLSGDHPMTPTLSEITVPAVAAILSDPNTWDWQEVLAQRRPLGPALHAAISKALSDYGRTLVPYVVEQRFLGRVIYAGGDDCLALLPAEEALAAARLLRALLSGHGGWINGQLEWDTAAKSGFLEWPEPGQGWLMTLGPRVTASVGIAIAHHQAPLDGVLAAAREAEETAKESYGRNAVCVFALKRSGAPLRIGSQWSYSNMSDPLHLFGEIRDHFREGSLSSKLAYDVVGQARALPISPTQIQRSGAASSVTIPPQAVRSSLERLLLRHKGDGVQTDEAKSRAKALSADLLAWAQALDQHRQTWETAWSERHPHDEPDPLDEDFAPQPGAMELGNWLLLARFLERGGEE